MSDFKITTPEGTVKITQNVGDLKAGIQKGDGSRISGYSGADQGVHTGSNSETLGRHGQPFSKK
jgi:hypothetical protein